VTNAARILARLGIKFELRDYQVDEEDLSAEKRGQQSGAAARPGVEDPGRARRPHRRALCRVRRQCDARPQSLAKLSGNRKTRNRAAQGSAAADRLPPRRSHRHRRQEGLSVFVDETIELFDVVAVSAGVRGTQILLAPLTICALPAPLWVPSLPSPSSAAEKLEHRRRSLGPTYFDLIGESTTFSVGLMGSTGQIWFRLESAEDHGRPGGSSLHQRRHLRPGGLHQPAVLRAHPAVSFRITDVGTFTVKGYLVEQVGPDIGKEPSSPSPASTCSRRLPGRSHPPGWRSAARSLSRVRRRDGNRVRAKRNEPGGRARLVSRRMVRWLCD